jgi:hypothetical protein
VTTQPRSPSEHYQAAERLLAAAETSVTDGLQQSAALIAICHALLCAAPRRARKRPEPPAQHGGSPQSRWLYGDDNTGGEDSR